MLSGTGRRGRAVALLVALCCLAAACDDARRQEAGARHFERGRELRRNGDLGGARREFERAVRLTPDSDNAHYQLGLTLDDIGEHKEAARALGRAVELNPARAVAHHNYGNVLRRLGDIGGDLREQSEAARLEPDNPVFLIALGAALEDAGDRDNARISFERAAAIDAEPRVKATALMRLGYLLYAQGEYAGASDALRAGLALDPTDEEARLRLKELEELRAAGGRGGGKGPPKRITPGKNF